MMKNYRCGLDIGSSKIAACLGVFKGDELEHLWWDSADSAGVKRGQCQDTAGLTAAISKLLKNLNSKSGIKIKTVNLGIASHNIVAKHSQAVMALAERGNRPVTKRDVQNVNQQAQILASCIEEEILHAEPLSYAVDNESEVINPLGLYGHQLKIDLYLISARVAYVNTMMDVINRLGVKLNEMTLSGLAASQIVFNPGRLNGLNILCDIGKDITQILIFNEAGLVHYQPILCGGDDLTNCLSQKLKLPYYLAEEVKISYGQIQNNQSAQDREIIVKKGNAYSNISQNSIIKILTQESRRVCEAIRDVIQPHLLLVSSPLIPSKTTLHVSGRVACLDGFLEQLEMVAGIPVKMASVGNPGLNSALMRNHFLSGETILNYLACLGLISGAGSLSHKRLTPPARGVRGLLLRVPEKIKEIYQEYF